MNSDFQQMNHDGLPPQEKPERVLAEIRRRNEEYTEEGDTGEWIKLVVFRLREDFFAFNAASVIEILTVQEIAAVPGCPDMILGVMNVRGVIESVLDPGRIMGMPPLEIRDKSRIIIATGGDIRTGVLVDEVLDVMDIAADFIRKPIATLSAGIQPYAVGGESFFRDQYTTLLDTNRLFSSIRGRPDAV